MLLACDERPRRLIGRWVEPREGSTRAPAVRLFNADGSAELLLPGLTDGCVTTRISGVRWRADDEHIYMSGLALCGCVDPRSTPSPCWGRNAHTPSGESAIPYAIRPDGTLVMISQSPFGGLPMQFRYRRAP
jgi:hypothetical protein